MGKKIDRTERMRSEFHNVMTDNGKVDVPRAKSDAAAEYLFDIIDEVLNDTSVKSSGKRSNTPNDCKLTN
jgi:hypothetical protein